MIRPEEISVIIQGPVDAVNTPQCIASIRRVLPGAEIIVSTWDGLQVEGAPDKTVFNTDPGGDAYCHKSARKTNNVNRQIVSTFNGLRRSERPYVMKFRSDLRLDTDAVLALYERFNPAEEAFAGKKILQKRVVVSTVYTRNPRRAYPYPFHLSDILFFGKREDVTAIFDIPLAPKEVTCYFSETHRPKIDLFPKNNARYTPEQYIMLSFLKKKLPDVRCEYMWDLSGNALETYEEILARNFIVAEPKRLGVTFTKFRIGWRDWYSTYAFDEWKQLYDRYVLGKQSAAPVGFVKNLLYPVWRMKKNRGYKRVKSYQDFKALEERK